MRLRKNQSDVSGEVIREDGGRRQREGKGWGPFSGAQLTVIIVTFAVLLLAPVGAWAVSGSSVFITDAHSNTHAAVNSSGQLQTHPNGTQAVTGSVTVNGATRPADPVNLYTTETNVNVCHTIAPPSGHVLVITSVHETLLDGTFPGSVYLRRSVGSCGSFSSEVTKDYTQITTYDTKEITFPSGLAIPDGTVLEIDYSNDATVTVNGYLLPDSYCPTITSCRGGG